MAFLGFSSKELPGFHFGSRAAENLDPVASYQSGDASGVAVRSERVGIGQDIGRA